MKNTSVILLISALCFTPSAWAENYGTPAQFIDGVLSVLPNICASISSTIAEESQKQGNAIQIHEAKGSQTMFCDCMPRRTKNARDALTKEGRTKKISESFFNSSFIPLVTNKCLGEQMRSNFATGCSEAYSHSNKIPDSAKFCSCMANYVSKISDDDIAKIGTETADYLPQVVVAKNQGIPAPEQPPWFKRFAAAGVSCAER